MQNNHKTSEPDNSRLSEMNAVCQQFEISDEDIMAAMRQISGYLDITPGDFKEVYVVAYRQAMERLASRLRAGDVMTRDVASVGPDTPMAKVVALLARRRISGLPVVDEHHQVVGIITEKDILSLLGGGKRCTFMEVVLHCLDNKGCAAVPLHNKIVGDIMTRPAITVTADWTAPRIAGVLVDKNINRTPVVDDRGGLIGIITRRDLVQTACIHML